MRPTLILSLISLMILSQVVRAETPATENLENLPNLQERLDRMERLLENGQRVETEKGAVYEIASKFEVLTEIAAVGAAITSVFFFTKAAQAALSSNGLKAPTGLAPSLIQSTNAETNLSPVLGRAKENAKAGVGWMLFGVAARWVKVTLSDLAEPDDEIIVISDEERKRMLKEVRELRKALEQTPDF